MLHIIESVAISCPPIKVYTELSGRSCDQRVRVKLTESIRIVEWEHLLLDRAVISLIRHD